jgi:diaminobutyrate-2-oxoglutarate transaminase
MSIFDEMESAVRSYCLEFPEVFNRASGPYLFNSEGRRYIDFLCGAGALNYGHNPREMVDAVIEYLRQDGIVTSLDLHTVAKRQFMERLRDIVMAPRNMDHVVQFTGPTGTNAIEAALKLARKVTKRTNVVAFTNGYHGASLAALSATGKSSMRNAAGVQLGAITRVPYDGYSESSGLPLLDRMLEDPSSGLDSPAAFLVEVVQGEGGLRAASGKWLQELQRVARKHGALLIVDDIQAGCGRTGTFFSFDNMGIEPDIICLSKSISGIGLPMALVLIRRSLDQWSAGQHNGTFRGNNLAFVAGRIALEEYWAKPEFVNGLARKAALIDDLLSSISRRHKAMGCHLRGRGFMRGLVFNHAEQASAVSHASFKRGLIVETCGPMGEVVKLLPPITMDEAGLSAGISILSAAIREVGGAASRDDIEPMAAMAG